MTQPTAQVAAQRFGSKMPLLGRRRWLLLAVWAVVWCGVLSVHGGYSWFYFDHGSTLLFGGHPRGLTAAGGLHLYKNYPQYQIGPLTFVVAALLRPFGVVAAVLVMVTLAVPIMLAAEHLIAGGNSSRGRVRVLLAELLFVPLWAELAVHYAHLDDVLVLALSVAAVTAAAKGRARWVGPLLGAAIAAKPWAAAFLPLLWVVPRHHRGAAVRWAILIPVLVWLPFVLADPGTLLATSKFTINNAANSALRAIGVSDPRTPSWCRPAQLALGLAVGAWSVHRRRWPAVLLAGVTARLLLDPGTYDYYTASVMVAALLADSMLLNGYWPATSLIAFTGLYGVHLLSLPPAQQGQVRALTCTLLLALCIQPGARCRPRTRGSNLPRTSSRFAQ